ncbi:DUF6053 domain-containing protein [Lysobacter enzymogenes]
MKSGPRTGQRERQRFRRTPERFAVVGGPSGPMPFDPVAAS